MELPPILFDTVFTEELFTQTELPTIVIDQPWEKIGNEEKILLEKILKAIGRSLHSISVKYQPVFDLSGWPQKPSRILYFGKPINGIQLYEVVDAAGVSIVASENLSTLLQNDEAKKKLWEALRKQFSV